MYKKSGTEESFLYDDKKGLEFSVLKNNEFLEKIKIESEKLEEDYKTTMNLSSYVYNIIGVSKDEYCRYYLTCFL